MHVIFGEKKVELYKEQLNSKKAIIVVFLVYLIICVSAEGRSSNSTTSGTAFGTQHGISLLLLAITSIATESVPKINAMTMALQNA